jgi:hypothetical protein
MASPHENKNTMGGMDSDVDSKKNGLNQSFSTEKSGKDDMDIPITRKRPKSGYKP